MRKCKLLLLTGFITDDRLDNVSFRDLRLPTITRSSDNAFDVFFLLYATGTCTFESKHDSVFINAASQVAIYVQTFSCFSPLMVCVMCCYCTIFALYLKMILSARVSEINFQGCIRKSEENMNCKGHANQRNGL